MRNDKFDVHALLRYGNDRLRAICKTEGQQTITVPGDLEALSRYDVVILGRGIEKLMCKGKKESLLDAYVAERNEALIFSRGKAFSTGSFKTKLEPVIWGESYKDHVRLGIGPDGRKLAAFRSLTPEGVGLDELPELVISRSPEDAKPLMATLAVSTSGSAQTPMPAVVHRRHGRGQVVSVGVDGLWRWGLTIKAEAPNTPFDRFWDQLILWLMAGRDFTPTRQYTFRPNSANVLLGEKAEAIRPQLPPTRAEPEIRAYSTCSRATRNAAGSAWRHRVRTTVAIPVSFCRRQKDVTEPSLGFQTVRHRNQDLLYSMRTWRKLKSPPIQSPCDGYVIAAVGV